MFKKLLLVGTLLAAPLALSETASADHNRCYRGYRAPVITYGSPYHGHHDVYRSRRAPVYGYGYGVPYGGLYQSRYASPYGVYGGYPYVGRGTSIGISRGGLNLYFGF